MPTTPAAAFPAKRPSFSLQLLVGALFVLSGACGLAYEVVWTRYLGLFLGNTVLLHTAVLGSFMGGMALGSLLAGRFADRIPRPLRVYGWAELGVAAYGALFPLLATFGQGLVAWATGPFPPGTTGLLVFRVVLAALLLIFPTLLMGMTYPLLTAHLDRSAGAGAGGANWLYFANCSGAVLGTLVTGLALIPTFGMRATVLGVAVLNALIALAAVALGHSALPSPRQAEEKLSAEAGRQPEGGGERWVLVAICLSGGTAFLYELVWTRFFAVSLGSSTYSFTLMLAAFITGLALGSVAAQLLPARRAPLAWLALLQVLIGLVVAASLPLYPRLPYWSWWFKWLLRPSQESIWLYHTVQYGLTFIVMAAPTFLFGLTFPTAIRAIAAQGRSASSGAAAVYGWNTLGTLGGVLLAGCVLIPAFGLRHTLQVGAGLNLAIGLLLLFRIPRLVTDGRFRPAFLGLTAVGALLVVLTPRWPSAPMGFGSNAANAHPPANWEVYTGERSTRKVYFYREDFGSTVAVFGFTHPDTGQPATSLVVDGKADASSYGDLPTQTLVGSLPLILKPDAREVFLLGLGSGMTAGSALAHPIERLDCAEISRTVAQAASHFGAVNRQPLRDPRMHLTLDDGRTFLAARIAQGKKYDVIISEPTNPWIAGVGNLFSDEAFQATARGLKPGGIVAQWFHSYALDDRLIATILKTFRRTFPHVMIFQGVATDFILIGSREPFQPDFAAMAERLRRPEVRDDLARSNITGLVSLLYRQVYSQTGELALEEGGQVNTDDRPILEFNAPHALYLGASGERVARNDQRFIPTVLPPEEYETRGNLPARLPQQTLDHHLLIEKYLDGRDPTRAEFQELLWFEADPRGNNPYLERRLLRLYLRRWPNDAAMLLRSARLLWKDGRLPEAYAQARRAAELGNAEAKPDADRIRVELAWNDRAAVVPSTGSAEPATR